MLRMYDVYCAHDGASAPSVFRPAGGFAEPVAPPKRPVAFPPFSPVGKIAILVGVRGDRMRIRIEVSDDLAEDEVLIRCGRMDESIRKIEQLLLAQSQSEPKITFYKQNREFYFPLDTVLFFETDGEHVYAHTADDAFLTKYRLYELEQILPRQFVRAAKSTIVNSRRIYSITRNLASSSLVQFADSHKQIYASRYYYRELRRRLKERGTHET